MRITTIDVVQLDAIAASFRARGRSAEAARREWTALTEKDRAWWRVEMSTHLALAGVEVNS